MVGFDWNIKSGVFNINEIANRVNADKLFVSLLMEIEKRKIDINKEFTLSDIAELIPRETAGVSNYATYGFSIMSMLSGQKGRDYFIYKNTNLRNEFTDICNNNRNRDNYVWRKLYLDEIVSINNKYIINGRMLRVKAGVNEKLFEKDFIKIYGVDVLKGKKAFSKGEVSISVDNSIEYKNKKVLIEIDSQNIAKLIVGQYVLLNELYKEKEKDDIVFLVIHYHKGYNPERTISNLKYINENVYKNKGLKFKSYYKDGFEKICKENKNIGSLIKKLYE